LKGDTLGDVYKIQTLPQYDKWFDKLKDRIAKAVIESRLDVIKRKGQFGNYKSLGNDILELKFNLGSGYRIYYGKINNRVILLTLGGDKSSQDRDIKIAKRLLKKYKENGNDKS
jgi:putative addiction module killer protein